jgi:hypothetical protein
MNSNMRRYLPIVFFIALGVPAGALAEDEQGQVQSSLYPEAQHTEGEPTIENGTSNDRLFAVLPNFLSLEDAGEVPPLSVGAKFEVVARGAFDPVNIPWYGLLAGISQAQNSEPGFGHGALGYAKRFAANAADGTIENFMVGAVLPSLLHQDPRFYQSSNGTFLHRLEYAMSRMVVTRGDSGSSQFNASEIFGSAITAGVATYSYHPESDHNLKNAASVWVSQLGYDTLSMVIREFWPDIRRKFSHERANEGRE